MKMLLLSFLALTSCHTSNIMHQSRANPVNEMCCRIYESAGAIEFTKLKGDLEERDGNLLDIYVVERMSGKPDRDLTIHVFTTNSRRAFVDKKLGSNPPLSIEITDTLFFSSVRKLSNSHYYQQCFDFSTMSIINLFEVKLRGKSIFTYSLDGLSMDNVCPEDKDKILLAYQIAQRLKESTKSR